MTEVFEDKRKLIKTFLKYDDQSGYILKDVSSDGRKAPFESNTLLLQILLEIVCRNVENSAHRRQLLFLKMWSKLTQTKVTDELKFHMDALLSVRNQAVAEFEKELMKELFEMKSDLRLNALDSLNKSQNVIKGASIYFEKYQSEFEEVSRIGRGGFGTVCKARHKIDDICYAVKKVVFKYKRDSDFLKVIREVKSFASLNHLNVVGYNQAWLEYISSFANYNGEDIDSFDSSTHDEASDSKSILKTSGTITDTSQSFYLSSESENAEVSKQNPTYLDNKKCSEILNEAPLLRVMLYIQMEYCDFDLRFWMDERAKGNPLPFQLTTFEIFRDILSGVAHIHSKGVIHRDLKPQNIFFSTKNNCMKIGDFGLATLEDEMKDDSASNWHCGTMPYVAPELRKSGKYDTKVDMYSIGVTLIELVSESKTRMELSVILDQILSGTIPLELDHHTQYVALMKNLVSSDPAVRFSAEYLLANLPFSTHSKTLENEIKHLKKTLIEKEKRIEELEVLLKFRQNPAIS
ncbi:eukaryotic translation initiation factor 2-alpha kinase 1 [Parasteatoda tepidariorum]|uniref:eukaryotic translation initiation factor 2-alpha kinase 1 n=1 Tax=Parasteatoda tepidariorum TaxID=114398 RepID=UPI001C72313B|nr:eukaryotic translation initiation factor 2-alpha kinase 1 isoform X1 [Parasteatoda tepidariorum]